MSPLLPLTRGLVVAVPVDDKDAHELAFQYILLAPVARQGSNPQRKPCNAAAPSSAMVACEAPSSAVVAACVAEALSSAVVAACVDEALSSAVDAACAVEAPTSPAVTACAVEALSSAAAAACAIAMGCEAVKESSCWGLCGPVPRGQAPHLPSHLRCGGQPQKWRRRLKYWPGT